MVSREELEKKIDKLEVNMTRTDRIVNGEVTEDVMVDDGELVPSIRKWQKEMEEIYAVPSQELIDAIEQAKDAATEAEALAVDLADPDKGAAMVAFKQPDNGGVTRDASDKLSERVSILDYGAHGGGVSDETDAFRKVEATGHRTVDLVGRTYRITPYWENTASGIFLTKDYVNGKLIVGGREIVFNNQEGLSRAAAIHPKLEVPATNKKLGMTKVDDNNFNILRPLGGRYWANYYLQRAAPDLPFNLHQLWINQYLAFKTADEPGVSYSGSNTVVSSASSTLYVNGRARRLNEVGASVEVEFLGGGDIFMVFYAREDSNHIQIELNGSTDHLVLDVDDSGNSYLDAYSSPVAAKQIVQIASGVPTGTHTVRATVMPSKNPNSGAGSSFWFNALAWDGDTIGPWDRATKSSDWMPGQSVLAFQERHYRGRYYYAAADGVTGSSPPVHTTGEVSDGGVPWVYRTASQGSTSYSLRRHRIQGAGSQLEYAYMSIPDGATTAEDIGGQAHGNERQLSYKWLAGNTEVSVLPGAWAVADSFEIQEKLESFHSQIDQGNTSIGETTLRRRFCVPYVEISHSHTLYRAAQWGWFYPHMWPLIHYNSASGGYNTAIVDIWSPCGNKLICEDYYYTPENPPYQDDSVEITKDYVMIATGFALQSVGSLQARAKGDTGLRFHAWLQVSPDGLDYYGSNSRTFASKSMNMSNKNPDTTPQDSMICKMYFMRYDGNNKTSLPAGAVIESSARYGFAITAS